MSNNKFNNAYLNTILDNGLSIKEHIKNNYETIVSNSNPILSTKFSANLVEQYEFVISNINNRSKKYEINKFEEIFIKKFLEKLTSLKKRYWITLDRYGNGSLMFNYNSFIVGRINLRNKNSISMQVLTMSSSKNYDNLTFEQSISYIDKWYNYIKYHLS